MAKVLQSIRQKDRQTQLLLVALIAATAFTLLVMLLGRPADELGLGDLVPWGPSCAFFGDVNAMENVNDCVDGAVDHAQAVALVLALNVMVGAPLAFRGVWRQRVATISFALISLFALVTILRNGLFYLPSAIFLGKAAFTKAPV